MLIDGVFDLEVKLVNSSLVYSLGATWKESENNDGNSVDSRFKSFASEPIYK